MTRVPIAAHKSIKAQVRRDIGFFRALDEYFTAQFTLQGSQQLCSSQEALTIALSHNLNSRQKRIMDEIHDRTLKARNIVAFLEEQFQLPMQDTNFKFLEFVVPQVKGQTSYFALRQDEIVEVASYNLAVALVYPERNTLYDIKDRVLYKGITLLNTDLTRGSNELLGVLRAHIAMQESAHALCSGLTYHVAAADDACNCVELRKNVLPTHIGCTHDHEQRHVIDSIIGSSYNNGVFSETQAYMTENSPRGIEEDIDENFNTIARKIRSDREMNLSDVWHSNIAENKRKLQTMKEIASILQPILNSEEACAREHNILSYAFSFYGPAKALRFLTLYQNLREELY